ncbi:hypothetical protein niasHT_002790 [Heterodera trifolii]|uniref:Uncharacterized protein n=1 Tax=Heterodera trifolii TaxID=157864 RepID=A0ABD2M857_9BILA
MNTENNDAENVHPNELEKMEKALKDGMKKSRSHEGELKKEFEKMADRLQNVVKSEMEEAMNALWGKMEERMSGQERVMAALVQSVDEFMAGIPVEQKEEKEQHLKSPTPEPKSPPPEQNPSENGESEETLYSEESANQPGPSHGAPQMRGRGQGGPGRRGPTMGPGQKQKRVNYLVRQLGKEFQSGPRVANVGPVSVERAGMVAGDEEAAAVRVAVTLEDAEDTDALVDAGHMDMDAGHMGIGAERAGHTIMEDKRITEREAEMALGTVHGRGEGCSLPKAIQLT